MATVEYSSNHPGFTSTGINGYKWEGLNLTDNVGAPLAISRRTDRTVQIKGSFDGNTVVIEGSLDGVTYVTLSDLQGSALSATAEKVEGVSEIVTFIRPRVSAGVGASMDVDVFLLEVGHF